MGLDLTIKLDKDRNLRIVSNDTGGVDIVVAGRRLTLEHSFDVRIAADVLLLVDGLLNSGVR